MLASHSSRPLIAGDNDNQVGHSLSLTSGSVSIQGDAHADDDKMI